MVILRKLILFVLIPALMTGGQSFVLNTDTGVVKENSTGGGDKGKKKKKKKKSKHKQPKKVSPEKQKKIDDKKKAKHDKNLAKLQKEKQKKADKLAKERLKNRPDHTKCDSTDIVRTSQDTNLLKKYIKIYQSLGGICYIIHLQDMATLVKSSDGFYTVRMRPSSDPRAPADWQTYLYCPIGKPDGVVALCSPAGDTVQMCTYKGEKKEGLMSWVKKGEGVIHQERYVADVKVWVSEDPQ